MCGSFALTGASEKLRKFFNVSNPFELTARYNIAPSQNIYCVRKHDELYQLNSLQWGLIPHFAKDRKIAHKLINARIESLEEKAVFRYAVKRNRCIVPASGFFEWREENRVKQPYYIFPKKDAYLGFAGIWETWQNQANNETIESCCIITQAAGKLLQTIHDRKPVILKPSHFDEWLTGEKAVNTVMTEKAFLNETALHYGKVSLLVNSPKNDLAGCIQLIDG